MGPMLAWIPFVTPAPGVSGYWWVLALPMSLFISMAWKAVRQDDMAGYWPAVAKMTAQVVLGMVAFFAALALVVLVIVPAIPAD